MTFLVEWRPSDRQIRLREALDRLMEDSVVASPSRGAGPARTRGFPVDVMETEEAIVVEAALPGVAPEDVEIEVSDDTLILLASREEEPAEGKVLCCERYQGLLGRSVMLPVQVNPDQAEAVLEDGILRLTLPKLERLQAKTIKVKVKS